MISEKQANVEILNDGDSTPTIDMTLDMESASVLMQMLSKNLYSDPIGSAIRETVSNSLDSTRRAGIKKPIVVSFKKTKDDGYEFCSEDFGIGLDHDDVINIISKYGKSTKRNSATEIGMFGLGFKSPLAYASSFFFVCRKDGVERKYIMHEGEDVNAIDLIYETPTKEANGVKVIIPVKYQDRNEFYMKMKQQLAYFENVYFDVPAFDYLEAIDNEFTIHRGDDYQYSEIVNDRFMHICLDNVYYPMDYAKLGINPIGIPLGLRFNLSDGLFPTPNREQLIFTNKTKQIILDKIRKIADHFMVKYNESIEDTDDVIAVFDHLENKQRNIDFCGTRYDFQQLIGHYTDVPMKTPKLKGVDLINLRNLHTNRAKLLGEYQYRYTLNYGRFTEQKNSWNIGVGLKDPDVYVFSDRMSSIKKSYFRETSTGVANKYNSYRFAKKTKTYTLFPELDPTGNKIQKTTDNYYDILNLRTVPRKQWRKIIKEYQLIQKYFTDKFNDFDAIQIPQQWLDDRHKKLVSVANGGTGKARATKLKGEINCRVAEDLQRFVSGKEAKFTPTTLKLEDLPKYRGLTVYCRHDATKFTDPLYHISKSTQKMRIISVSDREKKVLDDAQIHNVMYIDEFMEGKNKPFKRLVTGYLINQLMLTHRHVFSSKLVLTHVSMSLYEKIVTLANYAHDNYKSQHHDLYGAMLEVAEEHHLFDETIYPEYLEAKRILEYLDFLNPMMLYIGQNKDKSDLMVHALINLCKYYRFKVNLDNYCTVEIPVDEEIEAEVGDLTTI